jgi:hypothetical protein
MGASAMASERSPSMERMMARRAGGAKVGLGVDVNVCVGVGVWVGVAVAVNVGVRVGVSVSVGVAVGPKNGTPLGIWQASRTSNENTNTNVLLRECFIHSLSLWSSTPGYLIELCLW